VHGPLLTNAGLNFFFEALHLVLFEILKYKKSSKISFATKSVFYIYLVLSFFNIESVWLGFFGSLITENLFTLSLNLSHKDLPVFIWAFFDALRI